MAKKGDGKVLLVTDYFGILHKTPLGNKQYYLSQNAKNKNLQFGIKETTEEEADAYIEKNNGKDPKFVNHAEAVNVISGKDDEIAKLKAKIAELEKVGNASTKDDETAKPTTSAKVAATDLIDKINAAKTVEEVEGLVTNDETRVTVIDAAKAKKKELKDAAK